MSVLTRAKRRKAGIPLPLTPFNTSLSESSAVCRNTSGSPTHPLQDPLAVHSDEDSDGILWIQCDECKKWRRVTSHSVESTKEWYCHMNPNPQYQSCDAREEEWNLPRGLVYTYKGLFPGQLVWGKLRTYPVWPAIVTPDPFTDHNYIDEDKNGCIYHVEFLGKPRTHSWLPEEMVEPYGETCSIGGRFCPKETKVPGKLQKAIDEAEGLCSLTNSERLEGCRYIPGKIKSENNNALKKPKTSCSSPNTKKLSSYIKPKNTDTISSPSPPSTVVSSEPNPPLLQLTQLDMVATGLTVLKMLGLPLNNDCFLKEANKGIEKFGKLDEVIKRDKPKKPLSQKTDSVLLKTPPTSCSKNNNSTSSSSRRGRPKLCVQAKQTSASACLHSQQQRKKERERKATRQRRNTTVSPSVAMQNIEKYFKPSSNSSMGSMSQPSQHCIAADQCDTLDVYTDIIDEVDIQLEGTSNEQVVPICENLSLEALERDAQNDLTDINNLLESLDSALDSPLPNGQSFHQGQLVESQDWEIKSLVHQLTEMEDIIEGFAF